MKEVQTEIGQMQQDLNGKITLVTKEVDDFQANTQKDIKEMKG